jgi:hypothetical protein
LLGLQRQGIGGRGGSARLAHSLLAFLAAPCTRVEVGVGVPPAEVGNRASKADIGTSGGRRSGSSALESLW